MDFLDPVKTKQHKYILFLGYFFISILIILATIIFVYIVKDGYTLSTAGKVYQNGLIYVGTQPHPADIYLNGILNSAKTNKHIYLPEGIYKLSYARDGYRSWNRSIEVEGGQIFYADYPLLIPDNLITQQQKSYQNAPSLFTQSPDHKWMVVGLGDNPNNFEVFNISNPKNVTEQSISLPDGLLSQQAQSGSYSVIDWSDDNQHLLISRTEGPSVEYIELDISDVTKSFNLSKSLSGLSYTSVDLFNQKYDQFVLYNQANNSLSKVLLSNPSNQISLINNVTNYKTYSSSEVLYSTPDSKDNKKQDIYIKNADREWLIKKLPLGNHTLLNLASFNNVPYVVVGDSELNKVYVYKDPIAQLQNQPNQDPIPSQVLYVKNPNYVKFSSNAQFIMAENNTQFSVYDILNDHGYNYTSKYSLDSPQNHAMWMDAFRITYVSGGKNVVFEFDSNYGQTLNSASSNYQTIFDGSNTYSYSINANNGSFDINKTSFYTKADQP